MTEKKVDSASLERVLEKSLADLKNIAKGHASGGTATTKVEAMSGVGGASQVFHTPSNSDPGSWAGSRGEMVPEDGATDSVSTNGTDYAAGMRKSILAKLHKGHTLTAEEVDFVSKGGMAPPFGKKDEDDKDDAKKGAGVVSPTDIAAKAHDDEEDDKKLVNRMVKDDAKKSLSDVASEIPSVQRGLEVSEFLAGFAEAVNKSLRNLEERVVGRVLGAMSSESSSTGEFQKSLAEAVYNLGQAVTLQAQRIEQVETAPARGPKSTQVAVMEKSFGGSPEGDSLSKAQVLDGLGEMLTKGQVSPMSIIKFESTGEIDELTYGKVRATMAGRR